jgi:outer membrane protein assembly factor BamB
MNKLLKRSVAVSALIALSGCGALDFFGNDEVPLSGTRIAVRTADSGNALQIDAKGAAITLPAPVSNADWPQLNGNSLRAIGHVSAGGSLSQAWTANVGAGSGSSARIVSPPIAAGGRVYTLDAGATVSAQDASSGGRVWSVDLTPEGENTIDGFGGGLAHDAGRVYVSNGFGQLTALAATTGEVVWTAPLGAPSRAAPAVAGGKVFAVTRDNRIIAVDASSGAVLWTEQGLDQVAGILGGAAPVATEQVVIAPFSSGELNAYAAGSGQVGWIDDLTGSRGSTGLAVLNDVSGDPVISDGVVYAASQSGRFVAVNIQSGERLWTRNIGGIQPPYVAGDTIFFVSGQGTLVAMQKDSGDVVWATELGGFRDPDRREDAITWAGPILAGGKLLLTSDLGNLVAVNPADGTLSSEVALPGAATNGPIAAGGTVFVLTDNATLAAYR